MTCTTLFYLQAKLLQIQNYSEAKYKNVETYTHTHKMQLIDYLNI